MEDWEIDFEWLRIRNQIKESFKKSELPDLNAVLLLIGIQILGRWQKAYSKEEKQDLMHIAICELLSQEGIYIFKGRDEDGWPHYDRVSKSPVEGPEAQERYLIIQIIRFFQILDAENNELLRKNTL
ncbi:MAG: hypothetical protein ACKOZZ_05585 [Bacteroidota bacterium]|jgi:hypothetical protein